MIAFPPFPDRTTAEDPHAYGLRAFAHFETHGPGLMTDEALAGALSASIVIVTARDVHPPVREHWQTIRARLRQTMNRRQVERAARLAALDTSDQDPRDQDAPDVSGGSKVPTHPTPPSPTSPDAVPMPPPPPTRPAVAPLPFTL